MIATYYGKQCVKLQLGDLTIAYNPIGKESKTKSARFGVDIVLSAVNHPDYNGVDSATHGDRVPFVIAGPGEYEVRGIFIRGIGSEGSLGGKSCHNTIYTLTIDGIKICFLGVLSRKLLAQELEAIDNCDLLFLPIGGEGGMLSPSLAQSVALSLSPKAVVPLDYESKVELKQFLKEAGAENALESGKLTLKRKDIDGMDGDVLILTPSGE